MSVFVKQKGTTLDTFQIGKSGVTLDASGVSNKTLTVPNKAGTVALTSDVPAASPTTTKGDLIVRGSSADTRLEVGTDGQVLTADSTAATGVKWAAASAGGSSWYPFLPNSFFAGYNDSYTSTYVSIGVDGWRTQVSGSGASISRSWMSKIGGQPWRGGLSCYTGTTSSGLAGVMQGDDQKLTDGTYGKLLLHTKVLIPTLSTASERFTTSFGFLYAVPPNTTSAYEGCYIRYCHDVNSGKWQAVTCNGTGKTTTGDLGVTVAINTWYDLKVVLDGSTSVKYYVNNTLAATHTTNIPASTISLAPMMGIAKTAGSSSRYFYCEYYFVYSASSTYNDIAITI